MTHGSILIVDDEPNILKTLSRALSLEGYSVDLAESGEATLERLQDHHYDVIMLDVRMNPGVSGIDALKQIRQKSPDQLVVMMSGHSTIETAVQATRLGAYDFLEKPLSIEKILLTLENALKYKQLRDENVSLRDQMDQDFLMIGHSAVMKKLWDKIEMTAPTTGRAFILGENGTGKELVARLLHQKSRRQDKPFIKLNCAAVPTELIESELFGHEKGSFTGAFSSRKGKFELAHRGTLFLDEIGDMKLEMQSKLLRVLQEGEFERVGGAETIRVDVRVIAATNKDIQEEIRRGHFREDLYYRLNVVPFIVPPLRERLEDVPHLAEHFLRLAQRENAKKGFVLLPEAIEALQAYSWPGNVRELKNIVERLVILNVGPEIRASDVQAVLPPPQQQAGPVAAVRVEAPVLDEGSLRDSVQDYEKQLILRKLREHGWRISQTARVLGLERSHLYKKMKQYGIQKPTLDEGD